MLIYNETDIRIMKSKARTTLGLQRKIFLPQILRRHAQTDITYKNVMRRKLYEEITFCVSIGSYLSY